MERLASLISGGGTTMNEIVKATQSGEIPDMEIACIIASKAEAGGIEKARKLGVLESDIVIINPHDFRMDGLMKIDREAFGRRILEVLHQHNATVITQNGWIPYTPDSVTLAYEGRIFNQHPGDPKQFGGKGMMGKAVHAAVLEFQRLAGRTFDTPVVAHYAQSGLDTGAVVKRQYAPVFSDDTVDALQARALLLEHQVQIALLQDFVRGNVSALEPHILVHPSELELLKEAKRRACEAYPHG